MSNIEQGSNSVVLEDAREALKKDVRSFGKDSAGGADALPRLGLRLVQAAADGIVTVPQKRSKGDDPDDAAVYYTEYAKYEGKTQHEDRTSNGLKANISKCRKLIEFGAYHNCDAIEVVNRFTLRRPALIEAKVDVKSFFPALVDVARAQLGTDRPLSDDEIDAAITRKEPAEPTVTKRLQAAQKILDKLITGEDGIKCTDPHVLTAHTEINAMLSMMERAAEIEATLAKARELGLDVVETENEEAAEAA